MQTAGTLFLIWSMHAVVGAALVAPILYFGRKRAGWANWELLALVIPFCVWVVLMLSPHPPDGRVWRTSVSPSTSALLCPCWHSCG